MTSAPRTSLPRRSLRRRTVLLTRDAPEGGAFATIVAVRGGRSVLDALQDYGPPASPHALALAVARLGAGEFDWLVLTSARTVDALVEAVGAAGGRPGGGPLALCSGGARVACVGRATAAAAVAAGLSVDLVPERSSAGGLLAAWPTDTVGNRVERVLLPTSTIAPTTISDGLTAFGLAVERVDAFAVTPRAPGALLRAALEDGGLDGAVVTSASTARRLAEVLADRGGAFLRGAVPVVATGEGTALAAVEAGLSLAAVAAAPDAATLVATLAGVLGPRELP